MTKLLILALAALSLFGQEPTTTVTRVDVGQMRRMGIPGIPPGLMDHLQVIVTAPESAGKRYEVVIRYTDDGEQVEVKRLIYANEVGATVSIYVRDISRIGAVDASAVELTPKQ